MMIAAGGTVLSILKTCFAPQDAEAFAATARSAVDLAERFGGRSLGVYGDREPGSANSGRILLIFANRPIFEQFRRKLESGEAAGALSLEIEHFEAVAGLAPARLAEPRIPYHLVRYH